jgi:methionyl-tRNA formyltransferase
MKVVAIGRTEILHDSILEIMKSGNELALIITCNESSHYLKGAQDFEMLAKKIGAVFICTENINTEQIISALRKIKPDVAISVNWKTIIGQEVIDCFKYGIINAHAGDLPRYRGNAVPNWAIINGENQIVLTLHYMTVDLDAGPILIQKKYPLKGDSRIGEIYDFIRENCPKMFDEVLGGIEKNTIKPHEQPKDPALSLRCFPRLPRDSEIDWKQPAELIDRLVRAVSEPFNGAYTFLGTEKLIIWRTHHQKSDSPFLGVPGQIASRDKKTGEVTVIAGEGFLVLEEVELNNNGRIKPTQAISTIRTRLGMDITGGMIELLQRISKLER